MSRPNQKLMLLLVQVIIFAYLAIICFSTDEIKEITPNFAEVNTQRQSMGYPYSQLTRFMVRLYCKGKCTDIYYKHGYNITVDYNPARGVCICNLHAAANTTK